MTTTSRVTLDPGAGTVSFEGAPGGEALWVYDFAHRRPHLHPLRTPSGQVLTRDSPPDHPWHHGCWFTIKYVDADNFWEEVEPFGTLAHDGAPSMAGGELPAVSGRIDWVRPGGGVAVTEERRLSHVVVDVDAYGIDFDTTLTATADLTLDRTPFTTWGGYGGLAFRGRGDFVDTRILLADRSEHERVLGVRSDWLDLSGTLPEGTTAGIAVLGHPESPSAPVPWYGSSRSATYGDEGWSNFFNAAFLWDGPLAMAGGSSLRFRYRIVVHDGIWDQGRVADAYRDYLGTSS